MEQPQDKRPACFGRLDCVFPKGSDGLRCSPDDCLKCPDKVECLRTAVAGQEGLAVKEEKIDREYAGGHIGFLERWSRKKALQRRRHRSGALGRCWRFFGKQDSPAAEDGKNSQNL